MASLALRFLGACLIMGTQLNVNRQVVTTGEMGVGRCLE